MTVVLAAVRTTPEIRPTMDCSQGDDDVGFVCIEEASDEDDGVEDDEVEVCETISMAIDSLVLVVNVNKVAAVTTPGVEMSVERKLDRDT